MGYESIGENHLRKPFQKSSYTVFLLYLKIGLRKITPPHHSKLYHPKELAFEIAKISLQNVSIQRIWKSLEKLRKINIYFK